MNKNKINLILKLSIPISQKSTVSIEDASFYSGLSFYETEHGLYRLLQEYRGNLIVSPEGNLLFEFPHGFKKPWLKITYINTLFNKFKKLSFFLAQLLFKAWISIVIIFYFLSFMIILLILNKGNRPSNENSKTDNSLFFHFIHDIIFWDLRFRFLSNSNQNNKNQSNKIIKNSTIFYEKVNNFFLGPPTVSDSENSLMLKKNILKAIKEKNGYIGILETIYASPLLSIQNAEKLLLSLVIEHQGHIKVGKLGEIIYFFPHLKKTTYTNFFATQNLKSSLNAPAFFGNNETNVNILIFFLNLFNLITSLKFLLHPSTLHPLLQNIMFTWIPFIFSSALFAFLTVRYFIYKNKIKEIHIKRGRLSLISLILNNSIARYTEDTLRKTWKKASGHDISDKNLVSEINQLGGEFELDAATGQYFYKFKKFENEIRLLKIKRNENFS
ncbi:MAG: hypothetical protein HYS16_00235 [Deltaproteobacteria bacterium]|nr:MAG: hypothetical protein HYS16_00235 [Deltaproteobacteria bacterium]